jgi:hypothetical protein
MATNEKIQAMLANRKSPDEELGALDALEALHILKALLESALEARPSAGASDITVVKKPRSWGMFTLFMTRPYICIYIYNIYIYNIII